jgi:hypothetical protein
MCSDSGRRERARANRWASESAMRGNEPVYLFVCDGGADLIAVAIDMSHCFDPLEPRLRFDTFDDDPFSRAQPELDERFEHRPGIRILLNVEHELAVQPEGMDSEPMQSSPPSNYSPKNTAPPCGGLYCRLT